MTKAQATQIQAVRALLAELEGEHRGRAFTTGNDRAAYDARMECAAGSANVALTAYLIMGHVYGDEQTKQHADAMLNPLMRMLDGGDATFGRTDDGYEDPAGNV